MTEVIDGNDAVHKAAHAALGKRQAVVKAAKAIYDYYRQTGRCHYTQTSARMTIVRHKLRPPFHEVLFEDCSSFATACYWISGCPDPNGLGYNGFGYTGTLARHGKVVSLAQSKQGDLVFYGSAWPWSHVAVISDATGARHIYTFGHEGCPCLTPIDYRSDRGEIRSYL